MITLTPRQTEIARLITDGLSDKEIAELIGLAPQTVSVHIMSVFRKTGLRRGSMWKYFQNHPNG